MRDRQRRGDEEVDRKSLLSALVGGAIVGFAWLLWGAFVGHAPRELTQTVVAPSGSHIKFSYKIQSSPNTTSEGTSTTVRSIEFHQQYIIVTYNGGGHTLFFIANTIEFRWQIEGDNG